MDNEQKNMNVVKPSIQHDEVAPRNPAVEFPQEQDLRKVLKPEVLDL